MATVGTNSSTSAVGSPAGGTGAANGSTTSTPSNAMNVKTLVFAEDMPDALVSEVLKISKEALFSVSFTKEKFFSSLAEFIRAYFDKSYGRGWNCVVGNSFGAYVTHEIKTYIYYQVDGVFFLLWKMS